MGVGTGSPAIALPRDSSHAFSWIVLETSGEDVAGTTSGVRLILASASPRRRELLARLGLPFEVMPADVVEHEPPGSDDPRGLVLHNAALKADAVAAANPGAIVLGADTTVFLGGEVFHKPANLDEARAMLHKLSGRTHTVFTGLAVRGRGLALEGSAESQVTFRALCDEDIDAFFQRCDPSD
jgi:septum formation protein